MYRTIRATLTTLGTLGIFGMAGAVLSSALLGCGGSELGVRETKATSRLEVALLLLDDARTNTSPFASLDADSSEYNTRRKAARGSERWDLTRKQATALLLEAEGEPDSKARRRKYREAVRLARSVKKAGRDEYGRALSDFVALWAAYRQEQRSARSLANRFTRRYRSSGNLVIYAWIIKGEIAYGARRWKQATEAYRYVVGLIEHPLYALALYRTGLSLRWLERVDDGNQALREAADMGCAKDAPKAAIPVANVAATTLGHTVAAGPDGVTKPKKCFPATP